MIYYNEKGEIIDEKDVDLIHGYVVDRDIVHHDELPAITHRESKMLPDGAELVYTVVDEPAHPAYDEVVSQTYYYTGATEKEKIEAQLMYTAVMTDTILGVEEDV